MSADSFRSSDFVLGDKPVRYSFGVRYVWLLSLVLALSCLTVGCFPFSPDEVRGTVEQTLSPPEEPAPLDEKSEVTSERPEGEAPEEQDNQDNIAKRTPSASHCQDTYASYSSEYSLEVLGGQVSCFSLLLPAEDITGQRAESTENEFFIVPQLNSSEQVYQLEIFWKIPRNLSPSMSYEYRLVEYDSENSDHLENSRRVQEAPWFPLGQAGYYKPEEKFPLGVSSFLSVRILDESRGGERSLIAEIGHLQLSYDANSQAFSMKQSKVAPSGIEVIVNDQEESVSSDDRAEREDTEVEEEQQNDSSVENIEEKEPPVAEQPSSYDYSPFQFYTQSGVGKIIVSWGEFAIDDHPNIVDLEYRLDEGSWKSMGLASDFVIEDLKSAHLYQLSLRVRYKNGVSQEQTIELTTLDESMRVDAPQESPEKEVLTFSLSPHPTVVFVNWQGPRWFDTTKIVDYEYRMVEGVGEWQPMGLSGFYAIKNLQPESSYVIEFRVVYTDGPGEKVTATVMTRPLEE